MQHIHNDANAPQKDKSNIVRELRKNREAFEKSWQLALLTVLTLLMPILFCIHWLLEEACTLHEVHVRRRVGTRRLEPEWRYFTIAITKVTCSRPVYLSQ
jgi:hypothetical protein